MSCSIIRKPNGVVEVTEDVQLFNELVQETGSQLAALDMWAVAQMDEFQQAGYEKTAKDVRVFLDSYASTLNSLSPSETFEVKSFMRENGISTLSELHDTLTDVFKPEGEFVVDFNRMIQSGLYNESDLAVFDEDVVMDLMSKIESSEDFFVDVNVEAMYTDTETKTVFGTSSKITENDIYRELMGTVENFQDEASISAAVNELGYSDFTEKFNIDKKFAGEIIEKLSQMKRVPVLHIENGQLTDENLNTKKTVDATLLVGLDTLSLEADIEYLSEISPEIWQSKIENVRGVVKGIEASLVDMNVDVIGISQVIERRDDIIDLLLAAQAMLTNPTPGNIREFASRKDDLVPTDNNSVVLNLPEQYRSLNIVRLSTDKSQAELFEEFGLLKVGPSLYHKVDKSGDFVTGAYELLYQRVLDGTLEIPKEFKLAPKEDKPGVLEDLSKFVMSRNVGFKTIDHELASLSQLVFNHESVDRSKLIEKASQASTIQSNIDYLKGDFVTDFYNYYLEQKLANTSLYRNVLSKFEFKENDITLREPVFSRDMKFFKELQDYMKLKVDMGVDIDVDYKPFFVDEDIRVINNPEIISEYPGQTFQNGNYLVAKANNTQYVKKDGELYRRVLKGDNSTVFAKIQTSPGAVYMQVGNNFDINVEEAQQVLDVYDKEFKTSLTVEQYKDKLKKAGTDGTIKAQMKEFEISSVDDKPGMSVMRVGDSQVFFKEKVNPDGSTTNQIELDLITTKEGKRDKGSARKALQTFLNYTDSLGKDVYLFAQPRDRQTSVEGLIKFYKSEGFRSTSEFLPEEMIRRAKSSVKQQVIGEVGARQMEAATLMLDNLSVAKKMEMFGKTPKEIKSATGWEKGGDGKWKFETSSGKLKTASLSFDKVNTNFSNPNVAEVTLGQILDNEELFSAYPKMRNIKVTFFEDDSYFDSALMFEYDGGIFINKKDFLDGENRFNPSEFTGERRTALFHEIQHSIQDIEGFAGGSNVEWSRKQIIDSINYFRSRNSENERRGGVKGEFDAVIERIIRDNFVESKADSILREDVLDAEFIADNLKSIVYKRFAGEVEARNVQRRYDMSREERAKTLLLETEDVARDEQIFLLNTLSKQVIGESAVLSQQESDFLKQAKQMELQGEDALAIELQTGWFKEAGKWKMFSRETLEAFKIKSGVDIDSVKTLSQLIDNPALFRLYPDLKNQKVVFYDENTEGISEYEKKSSLGFQRGGVIYINKLRDSLGQLPISLLGPRASGIADSTLREELESGVSSELRLARFNEQLWMSTLAHELSHILQDKEGFPRGGSIRLFEGVTRAVLPGITNQGLGKVKEHYEENKKLVPESDRPVVEAYVEVIDNFLKYGKDIPKSTYQKYMLLIGEVDARTIEFALNSGEVSSDTPFSVLRDRLLELEGLSGQNLIPYTTNQEVTSAVVDKLKQTGLATDVVQMSTQEIEAKLRELGFDDNVAQQVIAWHGTPHSFDRFTTEKIGTGEGAQAFGWGLYFTELEDIGRHYAAGLRKDSDTYRELSKNESIELVKSKKGGFEFVDGKISNDLDGIRYIEERYKNNDPLFTEKGVATLYKVSLHKGKTPDQYTWLEWDRRLTEGVTERILKAIDREGLREKFDEASLIIQRALIGARGSGTVENARWRQFDNDLNGGHAYKKIQDILGSDKEASLFLLRAGIDGMKYPAERLSRGATSDTARGFNYVVYDENVITIEDKVQFQKALSEKGVSLTPQGFVHNKVVYLNTEAVDPINTSVHEFGHLYLDALKENFTDKYNAGLSLVDKYKDSEAKEYIEYVKTTQPNLKEGAEAFNNEVLAQVIGDNGAKLVNSKKKGSIKEWLSDLWNSIKELVGLSNMTAEQVANMSLQEFAEAVSVDLLGGESLSAFQYQAPPTSNPIMTEKYRNQDIDGVASIIDNNIEFLFNVDEGLISELDCQI